MEELGKKPTLTAFIRGLTSRWEQNNEPLPSEATTATVVSVSKSAEAEQEDYFNAESDEEIGPQPPSTSSPVSQPQQKRKRQRTATLGGNMPPSKKTPPAEGASFLGLDYDDGSDSDGSTGSPRHTAGPMPPSPSGGETSNLAPSPMAVEETGPAKTETPVPAASEEELQEIEQKMRAKRMREEQEEEEEESGLAGLLGGAKGKKPAVPKEEAEKGKKIKLSFGIGKKLS